MQRIQKKINNSFLIRKGEKKKKKTEDRGSGDDTVTRLRKTNDCKPWSLYWFELLTEVTGFHPEEFSLAFV